MACRVLKVSRSGYYGWRDRRASSRDLGDAHLLDTIRRVHAASRASYGAPRVHAELRVGLAVRCGRKRVARLMRQAGIRGIAAHPKHRRSHPAAAVHADLVQRRFRVDAPNRLWCSDIERHEALSNRVGVGDLHRRAVAAAW